MRDNDDLREIFLQRLTRKETDFKFVSNYEEEEEGEEDDNYYS